MSKKRLPSEAELANDPSLRWNDYKKWECLWSDTHNCLHRYLAHDGDMVQLATMNGITPLFAAVPKLSVRRPGFHPRKFGNSGSDRPENHILDVKGGGAGENQGTAKDDADRTTAQIR